MHRRHAGFLGHDRLFGERCAHADVGGHRICLAQPLFIPKKNHGHSQRREQLGRLARKITAGNFHRRSLEMRFHIRICRQRGVFGIGHHFQAERLETLGKVRVSLIRDGLKRRLVEAEQFDVRVDIRRAFAATARMGAAIFFGDELHVEGRDHDLLASLQLLERIHAHGFFRRRCSIQLNGRGAE